MTMKAIKGGTLVDANGVIDDPVVLIEDDKIVKVESGDMSTPEGAEVIDASGLVLMPGMVDCHVHDLK